MEIVVHLVDGEQFRFRQEDPVAIHTILSGIQPARFFQQKQILIHGKLAVSGFNTEAVELIEFVTDRASNWHTSNPGDSLVLIEEERYTHKLTGMMRHLKGQRPDLMPGDRFTGLGELVMRSGARLYLEIHVTVKNRLEARLILQRFLDGGGLAMSRSAGGHALVNPACIARFTFNPGPADVPAGSWEANRLGDTLSERLSTETALPEE